jgi:hypothetical protein
VGKNNVLPVGGIGSREHIRMSCVVVSSAV